jgi:hypothetical protein
MSEEEQEGCDCWLEFCRSGAAALSYIEDNKCGDGAVQLVIAFEQLVSDVHNAPPGMIAASMNVDNVDAGELNASEPKFFISDAASIMGCPQAIRDATLKTTRWGWKLFKQSSDVWKEKLTKLEDPQRRLNRFYVTFAAALFLREYGLWHSQIQRMPRHMSPEEAPDPFDMFSPYPVLNELIKQDKPLRDFNHFNIYGDWPEETDE